MLLAHFPKDELTKGQRSQETCPRLRDPGRARKSELDLGGILVQRRPLEFRLCHSLATNPRAQAMESMGKSSLALQPQSWGARGAGEGTHVH